MNRPKFRVWDKEERKWYKPTYKAYMNELHDIHIDLDGRLLIRTIDESGKRVTIHESMFEGRYELLQSTGLKDINGKEIFEGDVVKVHTFYFDGYSESEKDHVGVIRYGNIAGFLIKEWYLETVDNKIAFSDLELHEESFKILGNKFEHPHLLGEE